MKLYTDVFSGEEIISDSFKFEWVFERCGIEIKSSYIVKKEGDVDIGCGNAFGGSGEEEEKNDGEKVLDVVDAFKYNESAFDKKGFTAYIKGYMKKVIEYL